MPLGNRTLTAIGLRASLLQATWNYERQQGIGWAYALAPALERLYPDRAERAARLADHTAYFNTQPTLASVALGAVARLEEARVSGQETDPGTIPRVKSVLGSSLAALGDRLFWFTLRPFAACLGVGLVLLGWSWGPLALWLVYNAVHQPLRLLGVRAGYRDGPAAASGPLRSRLEALVGWFGRGGALIVGVIVAALMVPGGEPSPVGFQLLLA
ncbi:MAG TPA: PTS system mannose/fructose/sorbose family transporter subunit IID, partial [Dongiaceae bacterium]|nr:PTS system mannose/fructose/sorbose family transporter subunit IID [Dongiaceae bacterium]